MNKLALLFICFALSFALSGCSKKKDQTELNSFVQKVKDTPLKRKINETTYTPNKAYSGYKAQKIRDPFAGTLSKATTPKNQRTQGDSSLESYLLDSLRLVGTIVTGPSSSAIVQTPDGKVHRVTLGTVIGKQQSKIVDITEDSIILQDVLPNARGKYAKHTLKLMNPSTNSDMLNNK